MELRQINKVELILTATDMQELIEERPMSKYRFAKAIKQRGLHLWECGGELRELVRDSPQSAMYGFPWAICLLDVGAVSEILDLRVLEAARDPTVLRKLRITAAHLPREYTIYAPRAPRPRRPGDTRTSYVETGARLRVLAIRNLFAGMQILHHEVAWQMMARLSTLSPSSRISSPPRLLPLIGARLLEISTLEAAEPPTIEETREVVVDICRPRKWLRPHLPEQWRRYL